MGTNAITGILLPCVIIIQQFIVGSFGDDAISTVNGKKALHKVDERFLSISIDPAVILTGLNLSDASLKLARHLAPSFIRLAGPSTQFVKYVDFDESEHSSDDADNVVVTPSMWFGINEWFTLANLTPVFGINDYETTKGVWNPKAALPLLDLADKLNVTCYWQLGYDCANKTELNYKEDLSIFRHILDAFPNRKGIWKIVGSDLSKCVNVAQAETAKRFIDDLEHTISALSWENVDPPAKLLSLPVKPKIASWVVYPKCAHPVAFSSALTWAKQIGDGARSGFEVVFRQPRLHEIFRDTPAYWVSVLFKNLMGRTVLDVKTTGNHPETSVYAHCTKKQNSFTRSGAMTVFIVNNATNNFTTYLRYGTPLLKSAEVRSYLLTSPSEDSSEIFLNGVKLTNAQLESEQINLEPKVRRAKILNYLSITVPAKSTGFYVLPSARIPACITDEADLNLVLDEIYKDQNIPFSDEVTVELNQRLTHSKPHSLQDLQKLMEKELESDERYYKTINAKKPKKFINKTPVPNVINNNDINRNLLENSRNFFIERAKLNERQRKFMDNNNNNNQHVVSSLSNFNRAKKVKSSDEIIEKVPTIKELELELTSTEIRKILSDRAKVKAAKKNIHFTSQELEEIMNKATKRFLKDRNTQIKIKPSKTKRETDEIVRGKKDINMRLLKLKTLGEKQQDILKSQLRKHRKFKSHPKKEVKNLREKRDINMDLLKLKTDIFHNKNKKQSSKSHFENNEEKEATLRTADQTSEELLEELDQLDKSDEEMKSALPDGEVFADFADSDDEDEIITENPKKIKIFDLKHPKSNLFQKPKSPLIIKPEVHHNFKKLPNLKSIKEHDLKTRDQDVDLSEDLSQFNPLEEVLEDGEDFPCIHEYFNNRPEATEIQKNFKNNVTELWEFGETLIEDKKDNHLITPPVNNRAHDDMKSILEDLDDYSDNLKDAGDSLNLGNDYGDFEDDYKEVSISESAKKRSIDETLKNQQYQMLIDHLNNKKKFDFLNKIHQESVKRSSRSANYESLSDSVKPWRPFDVIGLKSDKKRLRKSLPPPKRTSVVTMAKRSVNGYDGIDSTENEIDTSSSGEKKVKNYEKNGNYPTIENQDLKLKADLDRKIAEKKAAKIEIDRKASSNIQKIRGKRADSIWTTMINKVTGFFQDIGGKVKSYIDKIVK